MISRVEFLFIDMQMTESKHKLWTFYVRRFVIVDLLQLVGMSALDLSMLLGSCVLFA